MALRNLRLRQKPRISYYEPEEPPLDEYVFCEECSDYVFEYCAIHGPLLVIPDDKVPPKPNFPAVVPRAALTIPHVFLHLAPSIIPDAGIGVFSTLTVPRGVRFGPYRGLRADSVDSMYCWQIYDHNNKRSHVVDAADSQRSNWMRYVNCARHWSEQNLVAYQYKGQLYYRTIKIIPRFTELLVFYGSEFANALRVDLGSYNAPRGYASKFGAPVAKKPKTTPPSKNPEDIPSKYQKKTEQAEVKVGEVKTNAKKVNISNEKVIKTKKATKCDKVKVSASKKSKNSVKTNISSVDKIENERVVVNSDKLKVNSIAKPIIENNIVNNCETSKVADTGKLNKKINEINNNCSDNLVFTHNNEKSKILTSSLVKVKPYKCGVCDKTFSYKNTLSVHMKGMHNDDCLYRCDICNKNFGNKTNLKIHLNIHNGIKPYKCDVCHKCFGQKGYLEQHLNIHNGIKPYKCGICDKNFGYKTHLKRHLNIHNGIKPYKCDICHKCFSRKHYLETHLNIHSGIKPYKCEICHKCFTQNGSLKTHLNIHNGIKPYKCDVCNKCFSEKSSLKKHIKSLH